MYSNVNIICQHTEIIIFSLWIQVRSVHTAVLPTIDPLVAAQGGCSSSADDVIAAERVSSRKRSPAAVAHRLLPDFLILVRLYLWTFPAGKCQISKVLCSSKEENIMPSHSKVQMKYKQTD